MNRDEVYRRYFRQRRYWASGLFGVPDTPEEAAFWTGWDRGWVRQRRGVRATQMVLYIALARAVVQACLRSLER